MLFDTAATLDVTATVLPAMKDGAVFVQCATVGVEGTERTTAVAAEHGVAFLDCPVLGTKAPAEQGKLVMLASGDPALRERVQPAFDAVGSKTIWVGAEAGSGPSSNWSATRGSPLSPLPSVSQWPSRRALAWISS